MNRHESLLFQVDWNDSVVVASRNYYNQDGLFLILQSYSIVQCKKPTITFNWFYWYFYNIKLSNTVLIILIMMFTLIWFSVLQIRAESRNCKAFHFHWTNWSLMILILWIFHSSAIWSFSKLLQWCSGFPKWTFFWSFVGGGGHITWSHWSHPFLHGIS